MTISYSKGNRPCLLERIRQGLRIALPFFFFAVALWVLHYVMQSFRYQDVTAAIHGIPKRRIVWSCLFTCLNYVVLTFYDLLAFQYIKKVLSYGRIALTSFIGYALSNNTGSLAIIAGTSVRFRMYTSWGLPLQEITRVVVFSSITFWSGFCALAGSSLTLHPVAIPSIIKLPIKSSLGIGLIFLCIFTAYLLFNILPIWKRPLEFRGVQFPRVPFTLLIKQIAVSSLDWILAASCLYCLLPTSLSISFSAFLNFFLLAQVLALISNVPGGLGVFEGLMVLLLSPYAPASDLLAFLIVYRVIYYLFPLGIAAVLLGGHEAGLHSKVIREAARGVASLSVVLMPYFLAIISFISGAVLLFSEVTPELPWRMDILRRLIPLPVIEASHFLASLTATSLLLVAWGLKRRLDAAYILIISLLVAGIIFSILKGLDYEEACLLALALAIIAPFRKAFYRKSALTSEIFSSDWLVSIFIVVASSLWLGLFAYKHVEYSDNLWWRFALNANAPRFLRATVGSASVFFLFSLSRLLHPAKFLPILPDTETLSRAESIASHSPETYAYLSLLGDKALMFNQKQNAFLMYGSHGRSWVAMGDPVGPEEEIPELVWDFRQMCDHYHGVPVFYEIGPKNLPLYIDAGLIPLKIGEEGRVCLKDFSLKGSAQKRLRHAHNMLIREGYSFDIIPRKEVSRFLKRFKEISDRWLADKRAREKGFSLGYFSEDYLRRFPAAVVMQEDSVFAFANLWQGWGKKELSVDLMRYHPDAPPGIMDFLFTEIMLWGKREGYQEFNLGMAPLAGLENRPNTRLWYRLGNMVLRHGEPLYNFQGIRRYKEKFGPVWVPKYIAVPSAFLLPRILADISALIASGTRGIFTK